MAEMEIEYMKYMDRLLDDMLKGGEGREPAFKCASKKYKIIESYRKHLEEIENDPNRHESSKALARTLYAKVETLGNQNKSKMEQVLVKKIQLTLRAHDCPSRESDERAQCSSCKEDRFIRDLYHAVCGRLHCLLCLYERTMCDSHLHSATSPLERHERHIEEVLLGMDETTSQLEVSAPLVPEMVCPLEHKRFIEAHKTSIEELLAKPILYLPERVRVRALKLREYLDFHDELNRSKMERILKMKAIKVLRVNREVSSEQVKCPACKKDKPKSDMCITECKHMFCIYCTWRSSMRDGSCPTCKVPVKRDPHIRITEFCSKFKCPVQLIPEFIS